MRLTQVVVLLLLAIAISGCEAMYVPKSMPAHWSRDAAPGNKPPPQAAAPLKAQGEDVAYVSVVDPRKVVYTGSLAVVVDDAKSALAATKDMAEKMGGYMQRATEGEIVVRVPAAKFEPAVAAVEKLGTTTRKEVTAQDVTEEYVDLEIRLKNARAMLDRLRALLAKAEAVKDILEIEREMGGMTSEVEKMEGQLHRLADRVAFATLTVTFTPQASAPEELKVNLPFQWLRGLGLESLLTF